jgi:ribosome-binding factor A
LKLLKSNKNFKFKTREKEQTTRQQKISQEIHNALVDCFQKSGRLDPALSHHALTITKVNITADLKLVNCFYLPFGNADQREKIEVALENSRYMIRDYVTKKINLKYSPEIRFFFDKFYETMKAIEEIDQEKSE